MRVGPKGPAEKLEAERHEHDRQDRRGDEKADRIAMLAVRLLLLLR